MRNEVETACERDPIASLVHEMAHASQDCDALDFTEMEAEAVRLENIYRRAKGICERTRYGDQLIVADRPSCAISTVSKKFPE